MYNLYTLETLPKSLVQAMWLHCMTNLLSRKAMVESIGGAVPAWKHVQALELSNLMHNIWLDEARKTGEFSQCATLRDSMARMLNSRFFQMGYAESVVMYNALIKTFGYGEKFLIK